MPVAAVFSSSLLRVASLWVSLRRVSVLWNPLQIPRELTHHRDTM